MASASPLDRAFSLTELVDRAALRELVERAARLCGGGVAVRGADGEVVASAGALVEGGALRSIEHVGDRAGDVRVALCPNAEQWAQLLADTLSALLSAGWARRMTSDLQEAT